MLRHLTILAVALSAVACVRAVDVPLVEHVTVATSYGPVTGVVEDGIQRFSSIPFAQPPVGSRRFQAPAPPTPWVTSRDVTSEPPECPQLKIVGDWALGSDEDCLYLHVYAPDNTDGKPLPVMFWIYGGGYIEGSSSKATYNGHDLAKKHNVIVVAPNYRLGIFGFLGLEELASESGGTVGNWALLDQRLAMKWVQANIANFGGDPNRVTIFGESAGGFSVCWHLASPGSNGLFHSAIMESGQCDSRAFFQSRERANSWGREYAMAVGCQGTGDALLSCLRSKKTPDLMKSVVDWLFSDYPFPLGQAPENRTIPALAPVMPWGPVVDGTPQALTDTPFNMIRKGNFNKVPFILGTNLNEGTLFSLLAPLFAIPGPHPEGMPDYEIFLHHALNMYPDAAANKAVDSILGHYSPERFNNNTLDRIATVITQYFFACSARRVARTISSQNIPVWLYQFTHNLTWSGWLGDYHSAEVPFVFGNPSHEWNANDTYVSNAMQSYWTNFTASNNPNSNGAPMNWPSYSAAKDINLNIRYPISLSLQLDKDDCDFVDGVFTMLENSL